MQAEKQRYFQTHATNSYAATSEFVRALVMGFAQGGDALLDASRDVGAALEVEAEWQFRRLGDANAMSRHHRAFLDEKCFLCRIPGDEHRGGGITDVFAVELPVDVQ